MSTEQGKNTISLDSIYEALQSITKKGKPLTKEEKDQIAKNLSKLIQNFYN